VPSFRQREVLGEFGREHPVLLFKLSEWVGGTLNTTIA
jgi:hypothetical protein